MAESARFMGEVHVFQKKGVEYLVVFNIYGASMILEIVEVLKEGNAKKIFLIGSLGG